MATVTIPRLHHRRRRATLALVSASLLALVLSGGPALGGSLPTGEHLLGQSSIEPAYDDTTGNLTYLLTPIRSPFPTHTSEHAVAPLYLVIYPPGTAGTFNCMGVPGNCPDHNGIVAFVATAAEPSVYGTDPTLVPGHDHLVAAPGSGGDFNIAWHVFEIVFTSADAVTHITTDAGVDAALLSGAAISIDLGFAFHCSVVPAVTYQNGTPL